LKLAKCKAVDEDEEEHNDTHRITETSKGIQRDELNTLFAESDANGDGGVLKNIWGMDNYQDW